MMRARNNEVWKKIYEEPYGVPLEYTTDEEVHRKVISLKRGSLFILNRGRTNEESTYDDGHIPEGGDEPVDDGLCRDCGGTLMGTCYRCNGTGKNVH